MLFNEPKLLKSARRDRQAHSETYVSVLFNEPKLLKLVRGRSNPRRLRSFSALQRAEIAEIEPRRARVGWAEYVSVLFNEPKLLKCGALSHEGYDPVVSVLFNEPKLLKSLTTSRMRRWCNVSVLFNEPKLLKFLMGRGAALPAPFQCSSTSRNC